MKTTFTIPDLLFDALKCRAAEEGVTVSELVTVMLRDGLELRSKQMPPLPSFDMGEAAVDISDRRALYEVLDAERDSRLYRRRRKH